MGAGIEVKVNPSVLDRRLTQQECEAFEDINKNY